MRAHSSLLLPHLRRLRQWGHSPGILTGLRQRTSATWTLCHLVASLYDVVSGPAGQRDWDRFRAMFVPDGQIVSIDPECAATKDTPASKGDAVFLTPDMFAQQNNPYFKTNGFFERSIVKRVEEFGNLVEVWSAKESRDVKDQAQPSSRGIDSFQIVHAHGRFWIASLIFDDE
jgi:hypothetical protein